MKIISPSLWIAVILSLALPLHSMAQTGMSIEEKETQLDELILEIDGLNEENSSLRSQLYDYEDRITELKMRIEELDDQINASRTE